MLIYNTSAFSVASAPGSSMRIIAGSTLALSLCLAFPGVSAAQVGPPVTPGFPNVAQTPAQS